jgi:hypothetical protein
VGGLIGFSYWAGIPAIETALAKMRAGAVTPFSAEAETGPHESIIEVQLVNPGSSYVDLKYLQHKGEYYAAKANTLPFFQFLSKELEKEGPQYSYTVDQLYQMTQVRYNYKSDYPSLEITVVGNSDQEAVFLASSVPNAFLEFLIEEEEIVRQEEYKATLIRIETTTASLLEAQKTLGDMELQAVAEDLNSNADYLTLSATVDALRIQLSGQAAVLAGFTALTSQEYSDNLSAFQRTAEALAKAQKDLYTLEAITKIERLTENLDYQITKGQVDNLSRELASLIEDTVSLSDTSVARSEVVDYLAIGNPTQSVAIPPERIRLRSALMIGAIIGLAVAWLAVNFRWLKKVLSSSGQSSPSTEDEEDWPKVAGVIEAKRHESDISGVTAERER